MSKYPKTRIVTGEYFADILVRHSEDAPPIYYWICQRFEVAEILGMGTAYTFEIAEQDARECLERLSSGGACESEPLDPPRYRVV